VPTAGGARAAAAVALPGPDVAGADPLPGALWETFVPAGGSRPPGPQPAAGMPAAAPLACGSREPVRRRAVTGPVTPAARPPVSFSYTL